MIREATRWSRPKVSSDAPAAIVLTSPQPFINTPGRITPDEYDALVKNANLAVIDLRNKRYGRGTRLLLQLCGTANSGETVKCDVFGLRAADDDGKPSYEPVFLGTFTGTLTGDAVEELRNLLVCNRMEVTPSGALATLLSGQAELKASVTACTPAFGVVYGVSAFAGFILAPYRGTGSSVDVRHAVVGDEG